MRRSGRRKEILTTLFSHSVQAHDDNESDGAWRTLLPRRSDNCAQTQNTITHKRCAQTQNNHSQPLRTQDTHKRCAHVTNHAHCFALCCMPMTQSFALRRVSQRRLATCKVHSHIAFLRGCPWYADRCRSVPSMQMSHGGLSGRRSQTQEESGGLGPVRIQISVQVCRA